MLDLVQGRDLTRATLLKDGRFDLGPLANAEIELARGNRKLIWGWKRDVGTSFRAIYFGGDLIAERDRLILGRWYLFYRHRAAESAILAIGDLLLGSPALAPFVRRRSLVRCADGQAEVRLELGAPDADDLDRVRRLQLRRPRRRWAEIVMPPPADLAGLAELGPADLYVGSGLSYEAGLPTLCEMHAAFGVDNAACTQFAVGEEDTLPERLAGGLEGAMTDFCAVHSLALRAQPTPAMRTIAELKRAGWVRKVFTDNVDNMLAKCGVEFERTRGSGVFNEVYPAEFASDTLVVVGVAADRRSLVRQARARGLQVVTVNPCEKIAPMVRHLDYIRPTDTFYQVTADVFFDAWSASIAEAEALRVA